MKEKLTSTEKYLKRIKPYVILDYSLFDIINYTKAAVDYLEYDNYPYNDVDEIIACLKSIPEIVKEMREIINEMEMKLDEYELQ